MRSSIGIINLTIEVSSTWLKPAACESLVNCQPVLTGIKTKPITTRSRVRCLQHPAMEQTAFKSLLKCGILEEIEMIRRSQCVGIITANFPQSIPPVNRTNAIQRFDKATSSVSVLRTRFGIKLQPQTGPAHIQL